MRTGVVAFLLGNIALLYWPYLPDISITFTSFIIVSVLVISLYKFRHIIVSSFPLFYYFFLFFFSLCAGAIYTSLYIHYLVPTLDLQQWEGKTIEVIGVIESIPYQTEMKQGFDFYIKAKKEAKKEDPDKYSENNNVLWDSSFSGKVKLSWYKNRYKSQQGNIRTLHEKLAIGQVWQLSVRLKKPSGLMNPGGFDYEKYLYQNRIMATGYIKDAHLISQVESPSSLWDYFSQPFSQSLKSLRQKLSDQIDISLADYPYKGLVKALAIGYRHDMNAQQWKLFLQTGTNHLVAISGLHIGLMSSLIWLLVNTLWKSSSRLNMRIPAYYVASILALLAGVLYAALAGFAIPTQRALIMLVVVFIALMMRREISASYIITISLLSVLLLDPLSPLSIGFWLSFSAVAIIVFSLSARLASSSMVLSKNVFKIWQLGKVQWAIFIGLLPMMLILFHQFSLSAPLANFLAVPLMSIIIVPLTLLSAAVLFIYEPLAYNLFLLLEWPIDALFWYLEKLTLLPESYYYFSEVSMPATLLAFIGCIWLLMPWGWPARWMGIILLLPAILNSSLTKESDNIPPGELIMTVLDVGQGLSTIIRTSQHTLLYDTGDKFSPGFNMSDMVSIPFLRLKGISKIDQLILSHTDRDHAGSYVELNQLNIKKVMSGEADKIKEKFKGYIQHSSVHIEIEQCHQGMSWQWDGVNFEVLSPKLLTIEKKALRLKANNQSCVVLVTTQSGQNILLTGDIEKKLEKQLIKDYPELMIDVLVVPHHGSKTSSSAQFLDQFKPEIAIFSYGYLNRFRHPADIVVQRYKQRQIKLFNTSSGAIELNRDIIKQTWEVESYRIKNRHFWHREVNLL